MNGMIPPQIPKITSRKPLKAPVVREMRMIGTLPKVGAGHPCSSRFCAGANTPDRSALQPGRAFGVERLQLRSFEPGHVVLDLVADERLAVGEAPVALGEPSAAP